MELRKVSATALAKAAEISRSTLNIILSGQARDMKVTTLERICHALGVSGDALLGYNSVGLVRSPHLHGLDLGGSAFSIARVCATCETQLAARELHLPGDCMMELARKGAKAKRIGQVFGLSTRVIGLVLREEHEARRRRRF